MVESRSMVRGPSPGPAPAAQARASSSRLTRSSWRTWPHRKLRRKVPRVDGALTVQPIAPAVPPVRNTSASSMQSPPASAEATSVIILSPPLAWPGARPRSRCRSTSWGRPRRKAKVAGRISPALLTFKTVAIGCSLFLVGFVFQKPLSQKHRSTFLPLQHAATLIPSVDWGQDYGGIHINTVDSAYYGRDGCCRRWSRPAMGWIWGTDKSGDVRTLRTHLVRLHLKSGRARRTRPTFLPSLASTTGCRRETQGETDT